MTKYSTEWLRDHLLTKPQYGIDKQSPSLASRLSHAKPEQDVGPKLLDTDQIKEGGAGRTKVSITRCGTRLLDVDNGMGGCKPLIDALRYQGFIENDDPQSVEIVFAQRKTKADCGTEVVIEKLP